MMLEICEIFHSLQGEGPFSGRPAVFLRLSGCMPPYCPFCDTKEALSPGVRMGVMAVANSIASYNCPFVVITGGEPFLQWNRGLKELERILHGKGMTIQYETSGRAGIPDHVAGFVILSPKAHDVPDKDVMARADYLKPLVGEDPSEALAIVRNAGFPAHRVWLMPMGESRDEQIRRIPVVWELCVRYGYRFSPRLHILAYDDQKSV